MENITLLSFSLKTLPNHSLLSYIKSQSKKRRLPNDINTQMDRLEYLYYQLVYSSLHVL